MKKYKYKYLINDISENGEVGYEAIIPKFPGMLVMGDTPEDLHQAVMETIEYEIEYRKKKGIPIPQEDKKASFNGRVLLRINPELHEKLSREAQANAMSLNSYIQQNLEKAVSGR